MAQKQRLADFDKRLHAANMVCTLHRELNDFPPSFYGDLLLQHFCIIVCHSGSFRFVCNGEEHHAEAEETVFLSKGCRFHISERNSECLYSLVLYRTDYIRDILGTTILGMRFYEIKYPMDCRVWHTRQEAEITHYISLLSTFSNRTRSEFANNEKTLLLLALTYRLCNIYSHFTADNPTARNPKTEVYMKLLRLIQKHYMSERGVKFYAEKLCLSPKYLSTIVKELSGFTVQQLVFQAITKQAIFYLKNTEKSIKEISDLLHFANASDFGTFFKKQTGLSPKHYKQTDLGQK